MNGEQDLVERLAVVAGEAVRARRGAIEAGGPGNLRTITIEVAITDGLDVTSWLEWRRSIRAARRGGG